MGLADMSGTFARGSWRFGLAALALFSAPAVASTDASQVSYSSAANFGTASLDRELERQLSLIASETAGKVGIFATEIGGTRQVALNRDHWFPMASTMKIAVAAAYLQGVDEGRYSLDSTYPLRIGTGKTGPDGRVITRAGTSLTGSDNQATDALLEAVGGPAAVNRWLTSAGITGQRVDRNIATLLRDDLEKNDPSLGIDKRDSSTPAAMAQLLGALHRGDVLSAQSRGVLLGAMSRCATGKTRIPALLPAGTLVAHKTGTLWSQTSDVGIIRLPDGRSVALVVFVTGPESHAAHNRQIAAIARTVYDNFSGGGYQTSQVVRR
jgi:beta-lactamase class A